MNVAQDGGERVEGEYLGRQWHGWSDGIETWKSFRVPYNANTKPEYDDRPLGFNLAEHAEGIGMTGWDWYNQTSCWVAFDFDAITGHSDKHESKLTNQELQEVKDVACSIPWVTVRHSTSGAGLHLYVFIDPAAGIVTNNHTEHAALARSIIGLMSAHTGFDFNTRVDTCGGNMWIWHRKMSQSTNGLLIIKPGDCIIKDQIPNNWRDHVGVISGRRRKVKPSFIDEESESSFEELTGQRSNIRLDDDHKKLITWLSDKNYAFWWDQDHHMLVTHTHSLLEAHDDLKFKGPFATTAEGKMQGQDWNCYCFPLRRGAWVVRRYSKGVNEAPIWYQDGSGYTTCYYNQDPDLTTASRANSGIEDPDGGFMFRHAQDASAAALALGADLKLEPAYSRRETKIKMHKDGQRLVVSFEHTTHDRQDELPGWLLKKGRWNKIIHPQRNVPQEPDIANYDDVVRHLITGEGADYGWVIKSDQNWHDEPLTHIKTALESMGLKSFDVKAVLGGNVFKPWRLVNQPFQNEYPGDRKWNRGAAQFQFLPNMDKEVLSYPTWLKILEHIGHGLDEAVTQHGWAAANGLKTGADYLTCWIASLFQEPGQPLPYLFLYGPQDSGKSILHESLSLLLTSGYQRADTALNSPSGFNGELENAILCVVEETDLSKKSQAYNRIKDWVTSRQLPIHRKMKTPYHVANTTHYIQCANEAHNCPIFSGDTRITMCFVDELNPIEKIPKRQMITMLEKEAPDFLAHVLKLEIPASNDRLNVPVITTTEKQTAARNNESLLESFIADNCYHVIGEMISISEFSAVFHQWVDPNDRHDWSKQRISKEMPGIFPKGRNPANATWHYGNISFVETPPTKPKLVLRGDKLIHESE